MRKFNNGFSLMEMMVVLLIVSIVAAVSAPMIGKKMVKSASGPSPWVWLGMNGSIGYNMTGNNVSAIVGTDSDAGNTGAKMVIKSSFAPQMSLVDDNNRALRLLWHNGTVFLGDGNFGFVRGALANTGTFINPGNINNANMGVAIGGSVSGQSPTAVGSASSAGASSVALGQGATAGSNSIAVGQGAVSGSNSIAIGQGVNAGDNNVAIGNVLSSSGNNILLGDANSTVVIRGQLRVAGDSYLGTSRSSRVYCRLQDAPASTGSNSRLTVNRFSNLYALRYGTVAIGRDNVRDVVAPGATWNLFDDLKIPVDEKKFDFDQKLDKEAYERNIESAVKLLKPSDRRLKNVGKAFTGGLEQIKKLEVFNYTFKKDETKTPHVGVMAQDLMKIFPDAVWKGEDGFYRIRMEDMFYAVVNAVKELDEKVTGNTKRIAELEKQNVEQLKLINELSARIDKLEKCK